MTVAYRHLSFYIAIVKPLYYDNSLSGRHNRELHKASAGENDTWWHLPVAFQQHLRQCASLRSPLISPI